MDEAMHAFFGATRTIVYRYGGRISELRGDGFTALSAHPLRSRIMRAAPCSPRSRSAPSRRRRCLRLAVHSGEIVVSAGCRIASSPTPRSAAIHAARRASARCRADRRRGRERRMSSPDRDRSRRDAAQLTPTSPRHAGSLVEFRALRGAPRRGATQRARSAFVGRAQELAIIRTRFDLAASGAGQVVCISGDPGIGKSRVLAEVRAELERARRPFKKPVVSRTGRPRPISRSRASCAAYLESPGTRPLTPRRARSSPPRSAPGSTRPRIQRLLLELLDVGAGPQSEVRARLELQPRIRPR